MPRQLWIPDQLDRWGVPYAPVSGWGTRGSSVFDPQGVTVHHDASQPHHGDNGFLNGIIHGDPGRGIPGPLGNFQIARTGLVWLVAAGRANHAGQGGYRGLSGNRSVFGIEAANNGTGEPWSEAQLNSYRRLVCALLDGMGRDPSWAHAHWEWTTRKIDPFGPPLGSPAHRGKWDMNKFRAELAAIEEEPEVVTDEDINRIAAAVWNRNIHSKPAGNRLTDSDVRTAQIRDRLAYGFDRVMEGLTQIERGEGDPMAIAREVREELARALADNGI